jgi:hypothetical protein
VVDDCFGVVGFAEDFERAVASGAHGGAWCAASVAHLSHSDLLDWKFERGRMPRWEVLFDGFTEDEILRRAAETIEGLIVLGEPLVFRVGSATVLGSLKLSSGRLVIELAQIKGGGEGVLLSLGSIARRYATLRNVVGVEWIALCIRCLSSLMVYFSSVCLCPPTRDR